MLGVAGRETEARALLAELEQRAEGEYVTSLGLAWIHLALGEHHEALTRFEKALEEGSGPYHIFLADSVYDPVRATPRFRRVLERIGLERWAEAGTGS